MPRRMARGRRPVRRASAASGRLVIVRLVIVRRVIVRRAIVRRVIVRREIAGAATGVLRARTVGVVRGTTGVAAGVTTGGTTGATTRRRR